MKNKNRQNFAPIFALGFAQSACGRGGGGSSSSPPSTPPPPPFTLPDEVSLEIYENHPTNKAVYDATPQGRSSAPIDLPADTADNNLFRMSSDGRIWWNASPDYEAETDSNGDGVYMIRLNHPHNDRGYTEIEVTVQDVEREFTTEQWRSTGREYENDYFEFTYSQVRNILPNNDFVKYIIDGFAYAMPQTGPLVLTWSIVLPDNRDGFVNAPSTDDQTKVDRFRENLNRAFDEFEQAANLKFIEVKDTADRVGDIRFHFAVNNGQRSSSIDSVGFFFAIIDLREDSPYFVYVHEIAHILGLKHPHETSNQRAGFPFDEDLQYGPGSERSIMSTYLNRTSIKEADIEALQFLYGAPGTNYEGLQSKLEDIGITPEII